METQYRSSVWVSIRTGYVVLEVLAKYEDLRHKYLQDPTRIWKLLPQSIRGQEHTHTLELRCMDQSILYKALSPMPGRLSSHLTTLCDPETCSTASFQTLKARSYLTCLP